MTIAPLAPPRFFSALLLLTGCAVPVQEDDSWGLGGAPNASVDGDLPPSSVATGGTAAGTGGSLIGVGGSDAASGGAPSSGGASSGGTTAATGGTTAAGGVESSGGQTSTGGAPTGGSSTGGSSSTGGAPASGGSATGSGGTPAAGGSCDGVPVYPASTPYGSTVQASCDGKPHQNCLNQTGMHLFRCIWLGNDCNGQVPGNSGGGIWENLGRCE